MIELLNNQEIPISITKAINIKETAHHAHKDSTEIYWVTNGYLKIKINDTFVTLNKGDILVIKPSEFHQVIESSSSNTVIVLSSPPWNSNDEIII